MPKMIVILDDNETYGSPGHVLVADKNHDVEFVDEEDQPVLKGRLLDIENLVDWALANGYGHRVYREEVAGRGGFR